MVTTPFAVGGNFHFQLIQHHVGQLAGPAGRRRRWHWCRRRKSRPPVWVVLALPDEPDMAFELIMLPESLPPLRQPDSSSAAATARHSSEELLSLCHKRYAPFISLGVVARQESFNVSFCWKLCYTCPAAYPLPSFMGREEQWRIFHIYPVRRSKCILTISASG